MYVLQILLSIVREKPLHVLGVCVYAVCVLYYGFNSQSLSHLRTYQDYVVPGIFWAALTPLVVWFGIQFTRYRERLWHSFAHKHSLQYSPGGYESGRGNGAGLWGLHDSYEVRHVLTGSIGEYPVRLYLLTEPKPVAGSVRGEGCMKWIVAETQLTHDTCPFIALERWNQELGSTNVVRAKGSGEVPIETQFHNFFRLHVTPGYENEALEIFSFDMLAFLLRQPDRVHVEVSGAHLLVYLDSPFITQQRMSTFYKTLQHMYPKLIPQINRMDDDFRALHTYYHKVGN